jgi:hypothetical protein
VSRNALSVLNVGMSNTDSALGLIGATRSECERYHLKTLFPNFSGEVDAPNTANWLHWKNGCICGVALAWSTALVSCLVSGIWGD